MTEGLGPIDNSERLAVRSPETIQMWTRDGVRLDADLWRPDAAGDFPVLLMRQAEGRRHAGTDRYAHPSWYAACGYLVVIQDVRGRGTSEGPFEPFVHEAADGADSIAWAASLPGSSGRVGLYGSGYAGTAQLLALATAPPALAALCPANHAWDVYRDLATRGGAFRLADMLRWALHMALEAARRRDDDIAYQALLAAARQLPVAEEIPSRPRVIRDYSRYSHYDTWLFNPMPGRFWEARSPATLLQGHRTEVPILHSGGWFDPALGGVIAAWRALGACGSQSQNLMIGPWGPGGDHGRRFDPRTIPVMDEIQRAWFDHRLRAPIAPAPDPARVRLFDMLSATWRDFGDWPNPHPTALHLISTGLAAATTHDGRLSLAPPQCTGLDMLVHHPIEPAPDPGYRERSAVDARRDVACYTTAPLPQAITLAGSLSARLFVEADAPSFDIAATVSACRPDGTVWPLAEGYRRIDPGVGSLPVTLDLTGLCATLAPGDALRISVAAARFPAHPVNPGTGAEAAETRLIDAQTMTVRIHTAPDRPSCLLVPTVRWA